MDEMSPELIKLILQLQQQQGKPILSDSMTGMDRLYAKTPVLQRYQNLNPRDAAIDRIKNDIFEQQFLKDRVSFRGGFPGI